MLSPHHKSDSGVKKRRNIISLQMKLEVINRIEAGERSSDISRALGLPPTTIRTICANADKIRESIQNMTPLSATKITRTRTGIMENMERLLAAWIQGQSQCSEPLTMVAIQTKAKSLFDELKKSQGESSQTESFTASRGWFGRFKKRSSLNHIKISDIAISSDTNAAQKFPAHLKQIIANGGYSPKQVFNVDETSLYWKRLPHRTYISKEEKSTPGLKPSNDRLSLLLGGNASGDFKFKPLVVYHLETPRALAGYFKEHLPVIWRWNKIAYVTGVIFQEWFTIYAIPALKEYCARQKIDFKILLIIDRAQSHSINFDGLSENVKVIFLPKNTTSLLQPMDQGAIETFKIYYLRCIINQLIKGTSGEGKPSVRDFWGDYNILKGIDNIAVSWEEVPSATMNGVWQTLWPECVNNFKGLQEIPMVRSEITKLAKEIGFDEIKETDVMKLLESHREELSTEELIELEIECGEDQSNESPTPRKLTTKRLSKAFKLIEDAMEIFSELDSNSQRCSRIKRSINEDINCYKESYQLSKDEKLFNNLWDNF